MTGTSLVPDRIVLALAVLTTGLLFVKDASDPVNVVKLSSLVVCALAAVALAVARVSKERVLRLPAGPAVVAALALLLALVVATIASPSTWTALYGTYGRNSGLFAYGSALLLFFVALRVLDLPSSRWIAFTFVLAALVTASYGLFQYAGIDAVPWNNPFNPIIASLGNPNFAAAYIAIGLPPTVWAACWTGWSVPWRVLSAGAALMMFVTTVLSDAVQGPLAAAGGLTVFAGAVALGKSGRTRRLSLGAVSAAAVLGIALLVAGIAGIGPGRAFFAGVSYRARTWYWEGALHMFKDSPVWGVGLDSYGIRWPQDRPIAVVRALGGDHFSDAAHSVPLQMLGQGGLVLGLSYLAFVLVVGTCLVRGLLRLEGQDRLLLGGLGGAWTAYQVQSLVSIDQVPLLVAHFVLAGAVVAASGTGRAREVRLPGAQPVTPAAPAGRRRGALTLRERERSPLDWSVTGLATVLVLVLAWLAVQPTRAARAGFAGDAALSSGDGTSALKDFDKATDLAPHVALYLTKKGQLLNEAKQPDRSLQAFELAAERDPFDVAALRTAGRLADALKDYPKAERYFRRAVALDPTNSGTLLDLTQFLLRHGKAVEARKRLEALAKLLPDDGALQATLGDSRAVTGDAVGARTAYQAALRLSPDPASEPNKVATGGLAKLAAPGA